MSWCFYYVGSNVLINFIFYRNFDELLGEFGTKLSSKLWEKILHLEGEDVEISEIFLFEELLK